MIIVNHSIKILNIHINYTTLFSEMPKIPQETTVQITGGPPSKILLNPGIPPPPGMSPPYIQVNIFFKTSKDYQ